MPVAEPAPPPPICDASFGPSAARRMPSRFIMPFWNMTPPTTTEMDVARFRTKPNVAVAVAMSRGWMLVCSAIRGAWKFGPTPMPAMIWKGMIRPHSWPLGRAIKRPKPMVMKRTPR